ncbi:MAG: hypothetical protein ACRD2Q_03045 [Terriglobales bacterium]
MRRAARDPLLVLAEIGWRWTFGAAALAISIYALGRLVATTHLTEGDLLSLRSGIPVLVADVVAHILEDAGPRLGIAAAIVLPAVAVLWAFASATGRAATLKALFGKNTVPMRAMFGLSFLRAGVALAGGLAWVGAFIVAGRVAVRGEEYSPGAFLVVFLSLSFLVSLAWAVLNWYLLLAPLFVVRDGRDSLSSIAEAARAVRQNRNAFSSVSIVFAFLHLFAFVSGTMLALMPLGLVGLLRSEIVLALIGLVTLGYFAFAAFLYIARLAAYVRIVMDGDPSSTETIRPSFAGEQPEAGSVADTGIQSAAG